MTAGAEKAEPPAAPRWRLLLRVNDEFALIQLIVLAMIVGTVAVPSFLSPAKLSTSSSNRPSCRFSFWPRQSS